MKKIEFTEEDLLSLWYVLKEIVENVEYDEKYESYFTNDGFAMSLDRSDVKNIDNILRRID